MRTLVAETRTITTQQQGAVSFYGELLGSSTSEADRHNHPGDHVGDNRDGRGRRQSCSACRWFEAALYRELDESGHAVGYVIHTIGRSTVPDEIDYARVLRTDSAFEVIELMTVRQKGTTFLPAPSSRALAQAASVDDDIREAYINRAVV